MMRHICFLCFLVAPLLALPGCGDGHREQTLSQVHALLRQWDGTENVARLKGHKDGWNNSILVEVKRNEAILRCEIRSTGADGLPYNSDDVVATAAKGPPLRDIAGKAMQEITRGSVKGIRQGIRDQVE